MSWQPRLRIEKSGFEASEPEIINSDKLCKGKMYLLGATSQIREMQDLKPQSQESSSQISFVKGKCISWSHVSEERNLALEASEPEIINLDKLCKGKMYVLTATSQNK